MHNDLHNTDDDEIDPAAQAFEALRDEVLDLSQSLNHLVQRVEKIPTHDYRKTLAEILRAQDNMSSEIMELNSHPAISLTPERFLKELEEIKDRSLQKERQSLKDTEDTLRSTSKTIGLWTKQARAANIQNWRIIQAGCFGFVLASMLVWVLKL